ncbi:signal peptidase II [Coprothermobacteraceae bacterium]|nr:signal peptidase II [Coprothermobacteraceae bacterium]
MHRRYNWLALGLYGFLVDRVVKWAVLHADMHVINYDLAWSLKLGPNTLYLVIAATFVVWYLCLREGHYLWLVGFGALGNLLDRLLYGGVIDFIRIGSFPAFNIADSLIVLGISLWAMKQLGLLAG